MGLIPQVKCSRCDRRYSGLRSRCPYCGARRSRSGKRVSSTDNSVWKLVIGVLLLVVLVAAVVVLLATTLKKTGSGSSSKASSSSSKTSSAAVSENEGVNTLSKPSSEAPSSSVPSSSSSKASGVEKVSITYLGSTKTDITMKVTEVLPLECKTTPSSTTETPVWKSSNESVFVVLQSGKVTAVGKGTATLTATVGGVTAECIIRVG